MSESTDVMQSWSTAWQKIDPQPAPLDLRRLVSRDRLILVVTIALEVLTTIGLLVFAATRLRNAPSVEGVLWLGSLVVFCAAATAFSIWNRSGLLRATNETTLAYIALCIDRCCARLLSARFALVLSLSESAFVVVWVAIRGWLEGAILSASLFNSLVFLVVFNLALGMGTHFYQRKVRRELESFQRLRAELSGRAQ